MKLLSNVKLTEFLHGMGDPESILWNIACAKITRSSDGKEPVKTHVMSIDSLKPSAFVHAREWADANGQVFFVSNGQAMVAIRDKNVIVGVVEFRRIGVGVARRVRFSSRKRTKPRSPSRIGISVGIFGLESWVDAFSKKMKSHFTRWKMARPSRKSDKKLHVMSYGKRGISLKPIASFEDPIERENYAEPVLAQFDHAVEQLSSKDPKGRLLIIHGPPGVGKTYMVRSMIQALRSVRCVLVPSQFVPQFTDPTFGNMLIRQRQATVLIIEDADMLLVNRGADNMVAITSMLNLADGMFGAVADVRLICTTNAKKLEMEPALLRSGRLIDQIRVENLEPSHAAAVHRRLAGTDHVYSKPVALADVYAKVRDK